LVLFKNIDYLCVFAALKADGSIKVWGLLTHGGKGAPVDDGYTRI
jgi:hypothetical protein